MPAAGSQPGAPLQIMKETIYNRDEVTYVCDNMGLHRISNNSENNELAISLHCGFTSSYVRDCRLTMNSVYTAERGGLWLSYL
jgi:hypothetical protein